MIKAARLLYGSTCERRRISGGRFSHDRWKYVCSFREANLYGKLFFSFEILPLVAFYKPSSCLERRQVGA